MYDVKLITLTPTLLSSFIGAFFVFMTLCTGAQNTLYFQKSKSKSKKLL